MKYVKNKIVMKNLAKDLKIQIGDKFYDKCDVVILPTKNHSELWKSKFNTYLFEPRQTPLDLIHNGYIAQHLYILSNEEIKEGDWVYDSHLKEVYEVDSVLISEGINKDKATKKIIATTDTNVCNSYMVGNELMVNGYPRPSNEFLKKFCELNGIWEVLVEVIQEYDKVSCETGEGIEIYYRLKTSPDNTITIKPVQEEKLYTKEEVRILLGRSFGYAKSFGCYLGKGQIEYWIKENLWQ